MTTRLTSVALLIALTACGEGAKPEAKMDPTTATTAAVNPTIATAAAAIAKAIDAAPGQTDSILTANHYTADSFEDLLYAIAADSASAAAYAAAMK